ncbi:MAG: ABC transporter substrate-binding protein [Sulfolobaceae archaeon]|nr:ABC transporter substrate-binding protein [Candidatus Jingweiarchaeum tengchongense]
MKRVFVILSILLVGMVFMSFAQQITLTFMTGGNDQNVPTSVTMKLVQEYEKLNPGIKIDVTPVLYSTFNEKLSTMILSNSFPDIIDFTTAYVTKVDPYLLNLAPYLKEYYNLTPDEFRDQIIPAMASLLGNNPNVINCIPESTTGQAILINKTMWEKAGILPPPLNGQTTPWTWNQWESALETVKKVNKLPYALSFLNSSDRLYGFITMWGVSYLNDNGQFILDKTPHATEAINSFLSLFSNKIIPPAEWLSGENTNMDFFSGITAAWWSGSWQITTVLKQEEATGRDYEFVYTPKIYDWFSVPGGAFIGACKTGNKIKEEAAAKFLMWLSTNKSQAYKEMAIDSGALPVYKGMTLNYNNDQVNKWINDVFAVELRLTPSWAMLSRTSNTYEELYDVNVKAVTSAIANNWDAEKVIRTIEDGYDKIVSGQ